MTGAMRSPRSQRVRALFGSAAVAAIVALQGLGCASLGIGSEDDPMRAELRRLEKEQRRIASQEQLADEADKAERAKHPETLEEKLRRGDAHLAAGRVPAALWDYASAHRLDPKAAAPRERLGYVHLRRDPERAQPLFESALALEPDSVSGHIGLGLSLLASGNREAGLQHLERAVALAPDSPKAQAALGVSLDQLGRPQDALKHLEIARDLRPHDSRILNNLGVAHLRAGSPERAEPLLRAALREDTRDTALRSNNLGMAQALQGRFTEALESFRRGGDEQSARSNLGYAHYVRGEYKEAIAEYERALLIGGDANVQVVRNLEAARHARDIALEPAVVPPVSDAPARPERSIDPEAVAVDEAAPPPPADPASDPWLVQPPSSDVPN